MFLAVDIGNTNIKLALFKAEKIFCSWRLATEKNLTVIQYKKLLRRTLLQKRVNKINEIDQIIICSVVPKLTPLFKKALFFFFKKRPLILGEDIIAPIKNLYRKPEQVGQDRLANAIAAFTKYGGPVIVVDFGTALTFDLVSENGSYLGGIIVPGMEVSLKALTKNADLLPEINLSRPAGLPRNMAGEPSTFLGRETAFSMKSGIIYGYSFLVEGILRQLKGSLNKRPYIVATGGEAPLMFPYCRSINSVEVNLTLEGLRIASALGFRQNNKQNVKKG